MKKFFYLSLAAAAMLAVGCDKATTDSTDPINSLTDKDKGYIGLTVNLPSGYATKAIGDHYGDFNDGTADAANVEDILLVLFSGENEADAKLCSAYNLSDYRNTFTNNSRDQITVSSSKIIAEIAKSTLVGEVNYAFVIINDHQFYEVAESKMAGATFTTLFANKGGNFKTERTPSAEPYVDVPMVNETTATKELTTMTFAEFSKLLVDESGRDYGHTSFMMTNATYGDKAPKASYDGAIRTLVDVTPNIYASKELAEANPAAVINVERLLAKVQVNWNASNITKLQNNEDIPVEIVSWDLDNVNTVTYLAKQFEKTWVPYGSYSDAVFNAETTGNFRFMESDVIDNASGVAPAYRTHWAVDPNYTGAGNTQKYALYTKALKDDIAEERGNGGVYYCPENTFDVTNMTDKNTTRLVVKAKLNGGKNFYTVTEDASVIYQNYGDAGIDYAGSIQEYIYSAIGNRKVIRTWVADQFNNTQAVNKLIKIDLVQAYMTGEGKLVPTAAGNTLVPGQRVVVMSLNEDYLGTLAASEFKVSKDAAVAAAAAPVATTQDYLANEYHFYYYAGGVSYYQALIKHFGNYETNWESVDGMVNKTTETNGVYVGVTGSIVTDPEARYLGRYGMVRNNWYNITLEGVRNVGSAVVPDLPGRPDDSVHNYIAVKINIMPWVMRVQGVIL